MRWFRDPKTGEMCGLQGLLLAWIRFRVHRDTDWAKENAEEVARLMGYEIVEDTSTDTLTENEDTLTEEANMDKPRICDVLGVEIGQNFKLKGADMGFYVDRDGIVKREEDDASIGLPEICLMINHPDRIIRKPRFTEQEVERAKAIKLIYPRAQKLDLVPYVIRVHFDNGATVFLSADLFPSIKPGQSYTLDEIIGGAE